MNPRCRTARYCVEVADPHPIGPPVVAPAADPRQIRACLSPAVAGVFDAEWESALDAAKATKSLDEIQDLLRKWRHFAYAELREPGWYFELLARAERIQRAGTNPQAVPEEDMQALIAHRLGK